MLAKPSNPFKKMLGEPNKRTPNQTCSLLINLKSLLCKLQNFERGQDKQNLVLLILTVFHQVADELHQYFVSLFCFTKGLSSLLGAGVRTERVNRE